jgi:RimJ/RimL family protein N-acetyltransferase
MGTHRLRDGAEVLIRPVAPGDRDMLASASERLSDASRYSRFLAPTTRLTEPMLDYLTLVDHHDHEALVALDAATGEGVGVARFVRDGAAADRAEAAVTVIDEWQGRGLGTLLLELLAARACDEGVTRFSALVLGTNTAMIELLRQLGPVRVLARDHGTVELEADLPPEGLTPELRAALRLAAGS